MLQMFASDPAISTSTHVVRQLVLPQALNGLLLRLCPVTRRHPVRHTVCICACCEAVQHAEALWCLCLTSSSVLYYTCLSQVLLLQGSASYYRRCNKLCCVYAGCNAVRCGRKEKTTLFSMVKEKLTVNLSFPLA